VDFYVGSIFFFGIGIAVVIVCLYRPSSL